MSLVNAVIENKGQKMKKLVLLLVSILLVPGSYLHGYFHAANDVTEIVSTGEALSSMVTLKLLEKNEIDKAKEVHSRSIDAHLETMDIISTNRKETYKFPLISLEMLNSYNEEEPFLESLKTKVAKDYLVLKSQ